MRRFAQQWTILLRCSIHMEQHCFQVRKHMNIERLLFRIGALALYPDLEREDCMSIVDKSIPLTVISRFFFSSVASHCLAKLQGYPSTIAVIPGAQGSRASRNSAVMQINALKPARAYWQMRASRTLHSVHAASVFVCCILVAYYWTLE